MSQTVIEKAQQFLELQEQACLQTYCWPLQFLTTEASERQHVQKQSSLLRECYLLLKGAVSYFHLSSNSKLGDLQEAVQRLHRKENQFNAEMLHLKTVVAGHQHSNEQLTAQVIELGDQLQLTVSGNTAFQEQLKSQREEIIVLSRELEQARHSNDALTAVNTRFREELELLNEQKNKFAFQLHEANDYAEGFLIQLKRSGQEATAERLCNNELRQELTRLNEDMEAVVDRLHLYETIVRAADNKKLSCNSESNKENNPQFINLIPADESLTSPRNPTFKKHPVYGSSSSCQKECLNEIYLKNSDGMPCVNSGKSSGPNLAINIEHRMVNFCSPMRLDTKIAAVADFSNLQPSEIKSEFDQEDALHNIDPYHCFFQLLVQCAKLNSPKFSAAALIDLSQLWQNFIDNRVPMNKWCARIEQQLKVRLQQRRR